VRLNKVDLLHSGTPADVFRPAGSDRIYKLFKRLPKDSGGRAVQAVFDAETEAYRIVNACPETASSVPRYFGQASIRGVDTADGTDASRGYHLHLCYSLSFVDGQELPAAAILEHHWGRALADRLDELGVEYWIDGSVFLAPDKSSGVLIDIATADARALYHQAFTAS